MRYIFMMVLCMLGSAASAQSLFSMESADDGRGWEAVGRLEISGRAFCTGALIAPTVVLTAAHCLFDPATGTQVPVEDMQFLAGWRNGRAAAYRLVRRTVPHPEFHYAGSDSTTRMQHDLALVQLQHPIRNTTITPFDTDKSAAAGDRVGVVSYAHDRSEAPSLQELCEVLATQNGVLVLSCAVDFGASGSPVFSEDRSGVPRIVSVVSSKAEANGAPVALAVALDGPLQDLLDVLQSKQNAGAGLERMTAGSRRDTGAKFIRP